MTIPIASRAALACPLSALLPPSSGSSFSIPLDTLPSPAAAIIGPVPPTAPLHLGLEYLSLGDLPDYQFGHVDHPITGGTDTGENEVGPSSTPAAAPSRPERLLLITGDRGWMENIEEEDEDWLRDRSGTYGVVDKLRRIDTRSACLFPIHFLDSRWWQEFHVAFRL